MTNLPFQTIAEVDNYLSGDTVECLLCGKRFQTIHSSHLRSHGITHAEYRKRFGIPANRSLIGAPVRARNCARTMGACPTCGSEVTATKVAGRPGRCGKCVSPSALKARESYWHKKAVTESETDPIVHPPFETIGEVDDYLSGDTVTCLLCEARLQRLDRHLTLHRISADGYRARFNIPFDRSLMSAPSRAAIRARLERIIRFDENGPSGQWISRSRRLLAS
jgi:predicted transcriptional regulator